MIWRKVSKTYEPKVGDVVWLTEEDTSGTVISCSGGDLSVQIEDMVILDLNLTSISYHLQITPPGKGISYYDRELREQFHDIKEKYNKAVKKGQWGKLTILRLEVAELYMAYGDLVVVPYGNLHDNAKFDAALEYDRQESIFREDPQYNVSEAKAAARKAASKHYQHEFKSREIFQRSKRFHEGINQILNSMATIIKYNLKTQRDK